MEISNNIVRLLELMDRPAFLVKDDIIVFANRASSRLNIPVNGPVKELIQGDYTPLSQSMQSLKLQLPCGAYQATAEPLDGYTLFVLEQDAFANELRVLSLASQQLRRPLTTLINRLEEKDPAVNHALHQLHRTICNMSDAYRYEFHHAPKLIATDVRMFIDELIESVTTRLEEAGIRVHYQGLKQDCLCMIDQELLKRCVLNLISNSVLAGSTEIHVVLSRTDKRLLLSVSDNGRGAASKTHSSMFHSFQRDPELSYDAGLGLGMQMVQAAAHAHKGTVLMEHQPGGGIRITVTLSVFKYVPSLRAPGIRFDYLGGRDHILTELSDILPDSMY